MTKTTSTQLSLVVKKGVTVVKEAAFSKGNRNGKGWVGGRYKITKGVRGVFLFLFLFPCMHSLSLFSDVSLIFSLQDTDLLVGVGCTHMPVRDRFLCTGT